MPVFALFFPIYKNCAVRNRTAHVVVFVVNAVLLLENLSLARKSARAVELAIIIFLARADGAEFLLPLGVRYLVCYLVICCCIYQLPGAGGSGYSVWNTRTPIEYFKK